MPTTRTGRDPEKIIKRLQDIVLSFIRKEEEVGRLQAELEKRQDSHRLQDPTATGRDPSEEAASI